MREKTLQNLGSKVCRFARLFFVIGLVAASTHGGMPASGVLSRNSSPDKLGARFRSLPMVLHVGRGLFRLWIVLSVLWVVGVAATTPWWRLVHYTTIPLDKWPPGLGFVMGTCAGEKTAWGCFHLLEELKK